MSRYYPVFVDLGGRLAVVAGEGPEIAARASALLEVGARVRVVSPRPSVEVRRLADAGRVELRDRPFEPGDLDGAAIAIAAGDAPTNEAVRAAARAARVPLNVVDRPELCDWIHGAVLRRGRLVVAISTSGAAPALAVRLRDQLAEELGAEYATFLEIAAEHRAPIAASGRSFADRRRVWYRLADSGVLAALRDGDEARARAIFAAELAALEAPATGTA